jgi:hypothetical protein
MKSRMRVVSLSPRTHGPFHHRSGFWFGFTQRLRDSGDLSPINYLALTLEPPARQFPGDKVADQPDPNGGKRDSVPLFHHAETTHPTFAHGRCGATLA